jgi:hypothetical protein
LFVGAGGSRDNLERVAGFCLVGFADLGVDFGYFRLEIQEVDFSAAGRSRCGSRGSLGGSRGCGLLSARRQQHSRYEQNAEQGPNFLTHCFFSYIFFLFGLRQLTPGKA